MGSVPHLLLSARHWVGLVLILLSLWGRIFSEIILAWKFFGRELKNSNSTYLIVIRIFKLSCTGWVILICAFLKNCSFSFSQIYVCRVVHSVRLLSFCCLVVCGVIPHFIPCVGNFYSLFSLSVVLEVCQFYWRFWRTCFGFDFSVFYFVLYLLFSYFCLLWVCLALFFLGYWEGRLDYWWDSFSFLIWAISAVSFPLITALAVFHKIWYVIFSF